MKIYTVSQHLAYNLKPFMLALETLMVFIGVTAISFVLIMLIVEKFWPGFSRKKQSEDSDDPAL